MIPAAAQDNVGCPAMALCEPHVGAHVASLEQQGVVAWSFGSVRDTLRSLGGAGWGGSCRCVGHQRGSCPRATIPGCQGWSRASPTSSYPRPLLLLVASFVRGHALNPCELFRCGGFHVLERLLHDGKWRDLDRHWGFAGGGKEGWGRSHCYQLNAEQHKQSF